MKYAALLLMTFSFIACDPYGFGYKKNPAYVLDESFKAVTNLDLESFLEVTAKEALCVYGNEAGLQYLKEKIVLNPENIKLKPRVLETTHFTTPKYVGYWSYYHERYEIEVQDKITEEHLLTTIVDCEFGADAKKNDKLINQKPERYKKKECRAIKLIPNKFAALSVPEKCGVLRVNL